MSEKGLVVEFTLPSKRKAQEAAADPPGEPVPRIARLLALAHKWEGMVRRGEVSGYAEIARRMGLSRARITQICNLALLSPWIQEQVLGNPHVLNPSLVRSIPLEPKWPEQKQIFCRERHASTVLGLAVEYKSLWGPNGHRPPAS